jgi:hypothetical protein
MFALAIERKIIKYSIVVNKNQKTSIKKSKSKNEATSKNHENLFNCQFVVFNIFFFCTG